MPSVNVSFERRHNSLRKFVFCKRCFWNATIINSNNEKLDIRGCLKCLSKEVYIFALNNIVEYRLTFLSRKKVEIVFFKEKYFCHQCATGFTLGSEADLHVKRMGHKKIDKYHIPCVVIV